MCYVMRSNGCWIARSTGSPKPAAFQHGFCGWKLDYHIDGLAEGSEGPLSLHIERHPHACRQPVKLRRSEEHTSELQSLMRNSYAVFCLKKKKSKTQPNHNVTYTTK